MWSYQNLLNLRRIALNNVIKDDADFFIEKAYRHYSSTYHTPLSESYNLPMEEVVKIYMEDEMKDWTIEDLNEFRESVSSIPGAVIEAPLMAEQEHDSSEEAWIAQQNLLLKKQEEKEKAKKQEEVMKKTHEALDKLNDAIKNTISASNGDLNGPIKSKYDVLENEE